MRYDSIRGSMRQKYIKVSSTIYLELELDTIEYRRLQAINRVNMKLARQLASTKRRKSIFEVQEEAELSRKRINEKAEEKKQKVRDRANTF